MAQPKHAVDLPATCTLFDKLKRRARLTGTHFHIEGTDAKGKQLLVNKNKIFSYVRALEEYGTRIGKPVVKHIDGNLWELRPLSNRIFFFYWKDNKFVLVHYYIKKVR